MFQHRSVNRLLACVIGNAGIVDIDRNPFDGNSRSRVGYAERDDTRWAQSADRLIQLFHRLAEHYRQLHCDQRVAVDDFTLERLGDVPRGIMRGAIEWLEAGQQEGSKVTHRQRNTMKYISRILQISKGMAVPICIRITPLVSFSSSKAAGTMLKLAAIGVIRVPQ